MRTGRWQGDWQWWILGLAAAACGRDAGRAPVARPPPTAASVAPAALSACDTIGDLIGHLPALRLERLAHAALDSSWHGAGTRPACRRRASGHFVGEYYSLDTLAHWLLARGWRENTIFAADGPNGTHWGLQRAGVTCILEGRWDGGDDTDETYVPSDTLEIHAGCAATEPADTIPPT